MKKLFSSLFFICLFVSTFTAQTTKPTATPTPRPVANDEDVVKISTNLIQVDVTVTDRSGKIVTDLKSEDFEIYENNEKQDITNFSFISIAPEALPAATPAQKNTAKNSILIPPSAPLRPEQVRRTVALVVDDLTLSFQSVYYVRQALRKFVDGQMRDGDLVAVIRTGGGIGALQQFTSDRRQLYAAIERIRWNPAGSGRIGAFAPMEASPLERAKASGAEVSEEQLAAERNSAQNFTDFQGSIFATGTLGALNFIIRGMKDLPGRKSVMLMSDGFKLFTRDESGFMDGSRILDSLRRLTDLANRASVVVYTMDARGLQTLSLSAEDSTGGLTAEQVEGRLSDRRNELFDTQDGLVYLARQTGGFPIINNNDLAGGIKKMLEDQKGYYLVGYTPDSETFDPRTRRFNKLNIKIKRPNLKVRYRSGFFGVTDEDVRPVQQTPAQQITAALTSPFGANGISLRLNALFGNDAKNGAYVRSLLHINAKDLKFTDEPDGTHKAIFDVLAISFGENGVVVDQIAKNYTLTLQSAAYQKTLQEGFVYNFVFPVKKAGAYQLRVAFRDSVTEKVGSANQFIEVPNLKKGNLTLSGVILENLTIKQFQDLQLNTNPSSSSAEQRPDAQTDTSLRRFKRGTVLRYAYEIYNAKLDAAQNPQIVTQVRIFRDGKPLFEGKQIPLDLTGQKNFQRITPSGALSLGKEMQPGDYVLQIIVTDNLAKEKRKVAAQFVQFEIVE
jgi:VWFA-related protein